MKDEEVDGGDDLKAEKLNWRQKRSLVRMIKRKMKRLKKRSEMTKNESNVDHINDKQCLIQPIRSRVNDVDDKYMDRLKTILNKFYDRGHDQSGGHRCHDHLNIDDDHTDHEMAVTNTNKTRKSRHISISQLKQCVDRPDLVELHDCHASYPLLVIYFEVLSEHSSCPSTLELETWSSS